MTGVKVSEYTLAVSLGGTEKIPLGVGVKQATTPDQIAAYVGQSIDLSGKLDTTGYPNKATVTGAESIPLADGVKEAITPDQIRDFVQVAINASSAQSLILSEDFVDFMAVTAIASPDDIYQIPASIIAAANLNWAGAVKIAYINTGGYIRIFPIIDAIAATTYTFDLTKGRLDLATVTYVPSTTPAPSTTLGNDRAYILCGIYRDQPQDNAFFNRITAAVMWTPSNPNLRFYANDGALVIDTGVPALQNTEYHVEIKLNGTQCRVYINRVLVITTTITLPVSQSVVAGIGAATQAFGGGQLGGIDIWIDWYGLRYTPNAPRAIGFNLSI